MRMRASVVVVAVGVGVAVLAPAASARKPSTSQVENKVEQVARQRGGATRAPRYATCIKSSLNSWSCDLEVTDTREDDGMRRFHTTARYVNGRIVVGTLRAY
jgi:hypothetical protein